MSKIPTVICPTFQRPAKNQIVDSQSKDRWQTQSTSEKKSNDISFGEMKDLHTSIKKFNADELKGKEKLKLKQDKLTELGAPPKKQQKVPFPIQMSRLRWKNKKDIEIKEMIKQSGVVLSIASNNNKSSSSKQNSKAKKVNSKSLNKLQPTLGLNTRKGVFHVSTKRK